MAFHFPLQTVLHFRQSMEHQQELRLRTANQQVARVRRMLLQLDTSVNEANTLQAKQLEAGTSAAELRFHLLCEAAVAQHRRRLEEELVRQESIRERQRQIYQQLRRQRETLQGLRDQQLNLYRKEAARREQRRLDDLFLFRRAVGERR
jgi:flagellar protein FliJ